MCQRTRDLNIAGENLLKSSESMKEYFYIVFIITPFILV